jgi:taurine dioxygenase
MIESKLAEHIGVEFAGVDARAMDAAGFGAIHRAWLERSVVVLRDQMLTPSELTAFARRFGELEPPPGSERAAREDEGAAEAREMWIISNVVENGRAIGALGAGEAEWHSDMTYLSTPPTASILYGREVPEGQGDTWFASMYAAITEMPEGLRQRIDRRSSKHDSSYTSAGELRKGMATVTDARQAPGAMHPLVVRHPETGRPALFPGRRRNAYIQGLDLSESNALLDELWAWCTQPAFVYRHRWRRGDLLVWDNRSTLHRRDGFDPAARRILWRCQVKGSALAAAAA